MTRCVSLSHFLYPSLNFYTRSYTRIYTQSSIRDRMGLFFITCGMYPFMVILETIARCMFSHTHFYTRIYTHVYTRIFTRIYTRIYARIYTRIYTRKHTHQLRVRDPHFTLIYKTAFTLSPLIILPKCSGLHTYLHSITHTVTHKMYHTYTHKMYTQRPSIQHTVCCCLRDTDCPSRWSQA